MVAFDHRPPTISLISITQLTNPFVRKMKSLHLPRHNSLFLTWWVVGKQAAAAKAIKDECEEALGEAMPALQVGVGVWAGSPCWAVSLHFVLLRT